MTLILPIIIAALIIGVAAKKMSTALWVLMGVVIIMAAIRFYLKH